MLTIATSALFLAAFFPLRATDENAWQTSGKATVNDDAGGKVINVSGDGSSTNRVTWKPGNLLVNTDYRLSLLVKPFSPNHVKGTVFAGPSFGPKQFYHFDFSLHGTNPGAYRVDFRTPVGLALDNKIIFGEHKAKGDFTFINPLLEMLVPFYRKAGSTQLGDGERVNGRNYSFITTFREGMLSRPLYSHSALFHNANHWANGWIIHPGSYVIYRHQLAKGIPFAKASIEVRVDELKQDPLIVSFSRNGSEWVIGSTITKAGVSKIDVPADVLPADEVYVRFEMPGSSTDSPGVFSPWSSLLRFYRFDAELSSVEATGDSFGQTSWVGVSGKISGVEVSPVDLKLRSCESPESLSIQVRNRNDTPVELKVKPMIMRQMADEGPWVEAQPLPAVKLTLAPNGDDSLSFAVPPPDGTPGRRRLILQLENGSDAIILRHEWYASDIQVRSSGWQLVEPIPAKKQSALERVWQWFFPEPKKPSVPTIPLWQAPGFAKIGVDAAPPVEQRDRITISAARNETESFQIVLPSDQQPRTARISLSPVVHEKDAAVSIPTENIRLSEVAYIPVIKASDSLGSTGLWPDPLPPLEATLNIPEGRNQPIHVRIRVPKDALAGKYHATFTVQAGDVTREVPVELTVFNFTLPAKPSLQTAIGISWPNVWRYHNVKTIEQKRILWKKYIDLFDAYRISPFDPIPLDFIKWSLPMPSWIRRGEVVGNEAYSGQRSLLVNSDRPMAEGYAGLQELIPAPKEKVKISFWYKTQSKSEPATLMLSGTTLDDVRQNGEIRGDSPSISAGHVAHPLPASPEWTYLEREFPASAFPSGQKLALRLYPVPRGPNKLGKAWFDDLKIQVDGGEDILKGAGSFELVPDASMTGSIDTTQWEEALTSVLDKTSFSTFRLQVPGTGVHWDTQWFQSPTIGGFRHNTPEHRVLLQAWLSKVMPIIKRHNLEKEIYLYYLDEPSWESYGDLMESANYLHDVYPEFRIMVTESVDRRLIGGVDIWVPRLDEVWADRPVYKERIAAGDAFWTYLCVTPWAPSPTVFLDAPATGLRSWIWQSWVLGSPGILYWETTFWNSAARAYPDSKNIQNPWVDPQFWLDSGFLKSGDKFPFRNGDGTWIYPPRTASGYPAKEPLLLPPVPSLRLESLRDGLDDFDYLRILESRLAELPSDSPLRARATELLERLKAQFPSLVEWSKDPISFEQTRAELAGMIEELSPASK